MALILVTVNEVTGVHAANGLLCRQDMEMMAVVADFT